MIHFFSTVICMLLGVAFFSVFERKVMGLCQYRQGPQKIGFEGIGQPFADAMKLLTKFEQIPWKADSTIYFIPPAFMFLLSLVVWHFKPVWSEETSYPLEGGYLLAFMSVTVFGLIFTGWFSSSKFALLGCIRGFAQSISYEVGLVLGVISIFIFKSTFYLGDFAYFPFILPLCIPFLMLFVIFIAELNRSPFDLAEGESELVSGYNVEYGGLSYTFTFLSENCFLLWTSYLFSLMFFKSSTFFILVFLFVMVWLRSSFVRVRVDKVMNFFWEKLLPLQISISLILLLCS